MEFKEDDVVICIKKKQILGSTINLEFGKRYIVYHSEKNIENNGLSNSSKYMYVNIKIDPTETYDNPQNAVDIESVEYISSRFIHENDWIGRIKYGV